MSRIFLIACLCTLGGAAAVACGWVFEGGDAFYRAYMHSWLLWLGISVGSMAWVMLAHLTGGNWTRVIRRLAEFAAMTMPIIALLFIPLAIGAAFGHLFPWAKSSVVANDAELRHRLGYFNLPFFLGRAAWYGVTWTFFAILLYLSSRSYDRHGNEKTRSRMYFASAVGLPLYIFMMGIPAATDWIMGLEPHYSSTLFGWIVVSGQAVTALAFLILILTSLRRFSPFDEILSEHQLIDLGSLLLTTVLLFCYLVAVQLVIEWMSNTQDRNHWYYHRLRVGWYWIGLLLLILHLVLPFFLLLLQSFKRNARALGWFCLLLLCVRAVYLFWMVNASGEQSQPLLHNRWTWMDFVFPFALGAPWIAGFAWMLKGKSLIPLAEHCADPGAQAMVEMS